MCSYHVCCQIFKSFYINPVQNIFQLQNLELGNVYRVHILLINLYGYGTWFYSEGKKVFKIDRKWSKENVWDQRISSHTIIIYALFTKYCGNQIKEIKMARHAAHMKETEVHTDHFMRKAIDKMVYLRWNLGKHVLYYYMWKLIHSEPSPTAGNWGLWELWLLLTVIKAC
jgi:hypothetical protein